MNIKVSAHYSGCSQYLFAGKESDGSDNVVSNLPFNEVFPNETNDQMDFKVCVLANQPLFPNGVPTVPPDGHGAMCNQRMEGLPNFARWSH